MHDATSILGIARAGVVAMLYLAILLDSLLGDRRGQSTDEAMGIAAAATPRGSAIDDDQGTSHKRGDNR